MATTYPYMLTTVDNPYDPFTQFDNWYAFDEQKGYCSCGLIARLSPSLDDSESDLEQEAIDDAINAILDLFPELYTVVYKAKAIPEGGP